MVTHSSWYRCPTCGRNWHKQFGAYKLSHQQNSIFEIVEAAGKRGISSPDLLEKLYADREDGGPLFAKECMYTTINRINKKIARSGKRIERKTKNGVTGIYVLREKSNG